MEISTARFGGESWRPLLAVLKGLRNGVVYGVKIRAPHALVMTFLFGTGSVGSKLYRILQLTRLHAQNLGKFVFLYKGMVALLRYLTSSESTAINAVAGWIGGYAIFGANNAVNYQIALYLFSRILIGAAELARSRVVQLDAPSNTFSLFSATCWGIVMWLFAVDKTVLQGGLRTSMEYLYEQSNNWTDLNNFIFGSYAKKVTEIL